MHQAGN